MKTKYLFGMLLSGAMLAACTADDDFNTAQKVKQDVNPSAPVFTVHFDDKDIQNRAIYNLSGTNMDNLTFQENKDLLSLYHGVTKPESKTSNQGNYLGYENKELFELKGWQNAVYTGVNDGEKMTFKTAAMVNPGLAVLVYPAKTTLSVDDWAQGTHEGAAAPNITLTNDQVDTTKTLTPYMSEIIDLAIEPDKTQGEAGYNKNYDIALKRVGSTLFLNLYLANAPKLKELYQVPDIAVKRVEFVADNEIFTTSIPVIVKTETSPVYNENRPQYADYVVEVKPAANAKHATWFAASELDLENVKAVKNISSSDVTNTDLENAQVIFTLLPFGTEDGETKQAENVTATVYTNYGKIEISESHEYINEYLPWQGLKFGETDNKKITAGLNGISEYFWKETPKTNSMFYDATGKLTERVGAAIERGLRVDVSDLSMEGLHVKNETELKNALLVYSKLHGSKTTPAYFYLDGDDDEVFTMTDGTWDEVITFAKKSAGAVICVPCQDIDGEKCTTVRLVNTEEDAVEVPELLLGADGAPYNKKVDVELEGNWKYTNVEKDKSKTFRNVNKLTVLADANLELAKYIAGNISSIEVNAGGNVDVTGRVYLRVVMNNSGTITIGAGQELDTSTGGKLVNNASTTAKNGYVTTGAGVIENSGTLSASDKQSQGIYNYGIINNNAKAARTQITANSDDDYVQTEFNKTNHRIGTINLYQNEDGEVEENELSATVSDNAKMGFLKVTISKKDPVVDDFGSFANYVIVDGEYTTIKYAQKKNEDEEMVDAYLPNRVVYIEVANESVSFDGDFRGGAGHHDKLKALVIPNSNTEVIIGQKAQVIMSGDEEANTSAVLVNGVIRFNGESSFKYDGAAFLSYFGGDKKDKTSNDKLQNYK